MLLLVCAFGQPDDGGAAQVPLLRGNDGEDLRVGQLTAHDDDFRFGAFHRAPEIVERRNDLRLHPLALELRVEPDSWLDVVKGDEDGHGSEYA